jgi:hypothetical protein
VIKFAKAIALRLPTIFQWPEGAKEGALLAYGPSQIQTFRQLGNLLGKVLRGADPGELPVEQPTKFELAVNLKTAKAIDVEVPSSLLLRRPHHRMKASRVRSDRMLIAAGRRGGRNVAGWHFYDVPACPRRSRNQGKTGPSADIAFL